MGDQVGLEGCLVIESIPLKAHTWLLLREFIIYRWIASVDLVILGDRLLLTVITLLPGRLIPRSCTI